MLRSDKQSIEANLSRHEANCKKLTAENVEYGKQREST